MAAVRPVLSGSREVTTSKRRLPAAPNLIDHIRGDTDAKVLSVHSVTKMGRFHAPVPRKFSGTPGQTSDATRRDSPRNSLRVGLAPANSDARLLITGTVGAASVGRTASLRQSASYTTSVDNPLSPRHARTGSDVSETVALQLPNLRRTESGSSLGSVNKTLSRVFDTSNFSQDRPRSIRTYNSALRLLPASEASRVLIPDADGVAKVSTSTHRANSPTFRSAEQLAEQSGRAMSPMRLSSVKCGIEAFEHPVREVRSFTPTRRFPTNEGRLSHIFATDENVAPSSARAAGARRACTPPPPPRGRCSMSLFDDPVVDTTGSRRCQPQASVGDSRSSSVAPEAALRGRRHFSAVPVRTQDGYLGKATSVQRSASRNTSSIVFNWL